MRDSYTRRRPWVHTRKLWQSSAAVDTRGERQRARGSEGRINRCAPRGREREKRRRQASERTCIHRGESSREGCQRREKVRAQRETGRERGGSDRQWRAAFYPQHGSALTTATRLPSSPRATAAAAARTDPIWSYYWSDPVFFFFFSSRPYPHRFSKPILLLVLLLLCYSRFLPHSLTRFIPSVLVSFYRSRFLSTFRWGRNRLFSVSIFVFARNLFWLYMRKMKTTAKFVVLVTR